MSTVEAGSSAATAPAFQANTSTLGSEQVSCEGSANGTTVMFDAGDNIGTMVADGSGLAYFDLGAIFDVRFPSYSPDGTKIVFSGTVVENQISNTDIYIMNSNGTGITRLTGTGDEGGPIFSPDGTKIAFLSDSANAISDLEIMNADGTGRIFLTAVNDFSFISFSPDSSKIIFHQFGDIYTVNADGTGLNNLTNTVTQDLFPQFSPDGSKIIFMSRFSPDNLEIYSMNANGTGVTRLTNSPQDDFFHDFNSDSSRIIFSSTRDGNQEIYVMNADGTNQTRLTNMPEQNSQATFSPDDSKILFTTTNLTNGNREIFTMNPDGTNPTRISFLGAVVDISSLFKFDADEDGAGDPCDNCRTTPNADQLNTDGDSFGDVCDPDDDNDGLSDANDNCPINANPDQLDTDKDGQGDACDTDDDGDGMLDADDNCPLAANPELILFVSARDGNNEIYSVNTDGSGVQQLTNSAGGNTSPEYNPAANKIVFNSTRDGNTEIYTMNPDGSNVTRLTNNLRNDRNPSFSPDGTKIVFDSDRDTPPPGTFHSEVYVMNADGTHQTRLTTTPVNNFNRAYSGGASYSPDGTRIVFQSDRDSNGSIGHQHDIYVMNADGTGVIRLTNTPRDDAGAAYSPDGSKIVFSSERDSFNVQEIYVMNANGAGQTRLTNNGTNVPDFNPTFSPDGSKIAFVSTRDAGTNHIFVMESNGANQTRLMNHSSADFGPSYLPQFDEDRDGVGEACDDDFDAPTQPGTNILVKAPKATVTFSSVTGTGTTSFEPITPGSMPTGYSLCPTCPAFDITTTAQYTPPVTVCLEVPAQISQLDFLLLRLMHGENGEYVDRTTEHRTNPDGTRLVCGVVQTLSPFALAFDLVPTTALVSVGGRVSTSEGYGIRNALISLTAPDGTTRTSRSNPFGYYQFDDVQAGQTYILNIRSKLYVFNPNTRVVSVVENLTELDWTADSFNRKNFKTKGERK